MYLSYHTHSSGHFNVLKYLWLYIPVWCVLYCTPTGSEGGNSSEEKGETTGSKDGGSDQHKKVEVSSCYKLHMYMYRASNCVYCIDYSLLCTVVIPVWLISNLKFLSIISSAAEHIAYESCLSLCFFSSPS